MTKNKTTLLALAMIILFSQVSMAAGNPVKSTSQTIGVMNQKKTVNVVTVDLNDPDISLGVTISNDKIGGSEDFASMIKREKPIAAINANYFDAYKSLEPMGSIMIENEFQYMEGSPASMLIHDDGQIQMGQYKTGINGYINGLRKNSWNAKKQKMDFNLFKIWYVNTLPKDSTGVYLYTPARGDKLSLSGGIAIQVKDDKVSKIVKNAKESIIPKDGYLIYYGNTKKFEKYVDARFKVGDKIELEYEIRREERKEAEKEKAEDETKKEIKDDKKVLSSKQTTLYGSINKELKNYWSAKKNGMVFNLFSLWYINSDPISSSGVYLYTPEKGDSVNVGSGHCVTVEGGKVSKIEYDIKKLDIPKDGFVIYYGEKAADKKYIAARFEIGYTVDFYDKPSMKIDTANLIKRAVADNEAAIQKKTDSKGERDDGLVDLAENNIKSLLSAGPYLVEDGKPIFDPELDGFKEDKITKNRAQRSAIGISKDNTLILVTGSNINMLELSQIMIELGADKAMNLDGGASSALYANGKVITPAGRKLSTVLMIYGK